MWNARTNLQQIIQYKVLKRLRSRRVGLSSFSTTQSRQVKLAYQLYKMPHTDPSVHPVLVMHGLFGSKANWRNASARLSERTKRRIYALDVRNHGQSPHVSKHTALDSAGDIVELMQAEHLKKVCALGHSMGGRAMMALALKYPMLVDRLVVVDVSPVSDPDDWSWLESIFNVLAEVQVPAHLSVSQGRKYVRNVLIESGAMGNEGADLVLMNLVKRGGAKGQFRWLINVNAIRDNLHDFSHFHETVHGLPAYAGPVLFIIGTQSDFVKDQHFPAIRDYFPKARIEKLNAGHLVHIDQPEQFLDLVVNFLK